MMATDAWRSTADIWAQRRYMGIVHLPVTTAALWATITATVHNAITMAYTATMSHTREPDFGKRPP